MSTTSVAIGANESTRRAAGTMAEDFGFDTSPITHAFRKQVERERVIPLGPEYPRTQQRVAGVHPRGGEDHRGEAPGLCHGGRDVQCHGGVATAQGEVHPAVSTERQVTGSEAR